MWLAIAAVALLGATYVWFPRGWAALLMRLERARSGVRRRTVAVDGRSFAYWDGGAGAALVMVHGFGADKDHWTAAARQLRGRFHVVAVDVPGFGATAAQLDEPLDVRSQAARIAAFIQALGIRRFHLAGSSMGGHIAGVLAHDFPERVLSLTLVECHGVRSREPSLVDVEIARGEFPLVPATTREFMRLVELAFVRRPLLPAVVLRAQGADAIERRPLRMELWRALTGPRAHLLESLLPRLTLPTLVVWGDSDHFFHRSAVDTLRRGLPHAQIVVMQRCGHLPMFERPAEFASHFTRFIAERIACT